MSQNGNRLGALRVERGCARAAVAAEFNVVERTVARWETGETPIPSDLIPRLAAMFGVTPDYLMGWDRSESPSEVGAA